MRNLPPGAAGHPNAPWNRPEPPECLECGNLISDDIDHADDCPDGHMGPEDMIEAEEAAHQEMKFEQRRLEERGL